MVERDLTSQIQSQLFTGKVIIITGPRQSGKTTLAKAVVEKSGTKYKWFNADEPDVRSWLMNPTSTQLRNLFGDASLVVIDEAQRIVNIGITLKLAVENIPEVQVIATGSSSFELTVGINEPLTGRKWEYTLYPFTYNELCRHNSPVEERRMLEHRMIYGYYPDVVSNPGKEPEILNNLINSYLFKDILNLEKIRKPLLLEKILLALAFQTGSEVSYNEIGKIAGADNQTIERYIDLLRKVFVVYILTSFSRNLRNELKKSRKIYFWDNGIRNGLIRNFNPVNLRNDTGALWENFLITERMKYISYSKIYSNSFFWRTSQQQEIDYIEERGGTIYGFEFKWSDRSGSRIPATFKSAYPGSITNIITRNNFIELFS